MQRFPVPLFPQIQFKRHALFMAGTTQSTVFDIVIAEKQKKVYRKGRFHQLDAESHAFQKFPERIGIKIVQMRGWCDPPFRQSMYRLSCFLEVIKFIRNINDEDPPALDDV